MGANYTLVIKTARRSEYADEYEGREGLMKLPYKMLLQQSEIRNGQLQSDIDELKDIISGLKARITELEAENAELLKGVMKDFRKEVKREEMYRTQSKNLERMHKTIKGLQQEKGELLAKIIRLQNRQEPQMNNRNDHV